MHVAMQVITSGSFKAMTFGVEGAVRKNPEALLKAYLVYELSRMKSVTCSNIHLHTLLLHEIVTDMALSLNWDWLFQTYVDYLNKLCIKPGFETRNFTHLVKKFRYWHINLDDIVIVAPFNKIGFQMTPSKAECEKTLASVPKSEVIAISALASGYLKLPEASGYIKRLPDLKGIAIGVSNEKQAHDTFEYFKGAF